MKHKIKFHGNILFSGEYDSLKLCVEAAVKSKVSLSDANLSWADLSGADLSWADLSGLRLPTGETWEEYLRSTVPALLTAGGKQLDEVANEKTWQCHQWENCPIK